MKTLNVKAVDEIRAILSTRHINGGENWTEAMLHAWAAKAEFQLGEGNPPCIELKSWESVSGHAEEHRLSDACIDCVDVELE